MIINLRQILASLADIYAGDHILAYSPEGAVTWMQFRMQVGAWEQVLSDVEAPLVALYERDSLEFMAALFALWRLGKQVVVPANNLSLTCEQLGQMTQVFVGDFPLEGTISRGQFTVGNHLDLDKYPHKEHPTPALVLFTSGSTGSPEPIPKQFEQLEAEVTVLENLWGNQLGAACITSTVSHQHIYGLLFRLLWPVSTGRPFVTRERDYWEELAVDAATYQPIAIVSSPAHLSRIPPLKWPVSPSAIFSSGAPLTTQDALSASDYFGVPATEVYGSTETGGIAWRQQTQGLVWTCMPGVSVRCKDILGLLEVRSAHLPNSEWFATADRASIDSTGGFSLCGRADRIAKVAGKRISLSAIERTLEQHPWVQQARVLLLPERGERLGTVLVLTNEGNKRLVDQGKNNLNGLLKTDLAKVVDRVAIPRYWRYLAELPHNSQGKTTAVELEQLFNQEPLPRLPELVSCKWEGTSSLLFKLFIPANLYYFDGHFPGRPVLPGVVQTHWAVHYAREHWDPLGEFAGLEALKFQQVIGANQLLELRLEYQPGNSEQTGKLYFNYTSLLAPDQYAAHSSGRILFRQGGH